MDEIDWEALAAELPVITVVDQATFDAMRQHPAFQGVPPEVINRAMN
jgi:hypothetical protein